MEGIQYVTNEKREKVAVQINLKKFGELWEDFYDDLLAKSRAKEPRELVESVKERLRRQGKRVDEYVITFARSARRELEALTIETWAVYFKRSSGL